MMISGGSEQLIVFVILYYPVLLCPVLDRTGLGRSCSSLEEEEGEEIEIEIEIDGAPVKW